MAVHNIPLDDAERQSLPRCRIICLAFEKPEIPNIGKWNSAIEATGLELKLATLSIAGVIHPEFMPKISLTEEEWRSTKAISTESRYINLVNEILNQVIQHCVLQNVQQTTNQRFGPPKNKGHAAEFLGNILFLSRCAERQREETAATSVRQDPAAIDVI
ncbi:hypothetical protein PR048_010250, partial [Dryococelus australis]